MSTPCGERGLLGVALHPNFPSNGYVYLYHTVPGTPAHNRVTRFTADGDVALSGSAVPILDLDNLRNARNHNGGAIHFGKDGKLYVAVGENAQPANAQSLANRLGKMLRLNADGTIPPDNPSTFPLIAGATTGANRSIWAVGLRNPFTFAFQPHSGAMLINEVGAATFEEINAGAAGANYGWPADRRPDRDRRCPQPDPGLSARHREPHGLRHQPAEPSIIPNRPSSQQATSASTFLRTIAAIGSTISILRRRAR